MTLSSRVCKDEDPNHSESFVQSFSGAISSPVYLPDIVTFAEDPRFVGQPGRRLYPRQKTLLRVIDLDVENMTDYDWLVADEWMTSFYASELRQGVSPDLFERMDVLENLDYPHFREVLLLIGRRGGKGLMCAVLAAYKAWSLIVLDDPQRHYGIDPSKDIKIVVTATQEQQAKFNQFRDIVNVIIEGACFQDRILANTDTRLVIETPASRRRQEAAVREGRVIRSSGNIIVEASSSNARATRGAAVIMVVHDEFAHLQTDLPGPNTAEAIYTALGPALDQFKKDALVLIPTTPATQIGPAYEIYEAGLEIDPSSGKASHPQILVSQLPSTALYEDFDMPNATDGNLFETAPQERNDVWLAEERRNPRTFSVERLAQWASVQDNFLEPSVIEAIFSPFCTRCGAPLNRDVACVEGGAHGPGRELLQQDAGPLRFAYRAHLDPATKKANFAMAIGHLEAFPDASGEMLFHVVVDLVIVWKPEDSRDGVIDVRAVGRDVVKIVTRFPSLTHLTFDQHLAGYTVPHMKEELKRRRHNAKVFEITATASSNASRDEGFETAANMGLIHAPVVDLFKKELAFLQIKDGKVVAPRSGPVTKKDTYDAVATVAFELLDGVRRRATRSRLGESTPSFGAPGGYYTPEDSIVRPGISIARQRLIANASRRRDPNLEASIARQNRYRERPG